MNKKRLVEQIIFELTTLLQQTVQAAQQAYDTATSEENVAENKYDTLGLEAAYLAEGQSKRVAEYEANLTAYRQLLNTKMESTNDVSIGALIELCDEGGEMMTLFLGPASGGLVFSYAEQDASRDISIITPESPIGKVLKGRTQGDEVVLNIGHNTKYFEVMTVI